MDEWFPGKGRRKFSNRKGLRNVAQVGKREYNSEDVKNGSKKYTIRK